MLSRPLTIKAKIYLGFVFLVLTQLFNGGLGYYALTNMQGSFASLRELNELHTAVLQIDRNVQRLRWSVNQYIFTGQDSQRLIAETLTEEIKSEIGTLLPQFESHEIPDTFRIILDRLDDYREEFQLVVEERRVRADLVQNQLPEKSARITKLLRGYLDGQAQPRDQIVVLSAQRSLATAEKDLLRYYALPDSGLVTDSVLNFQQARAQLEGIISDDADSGQSELLEAIEDYERTGLRAVQATRGYLFLVNVLMAGEASEIAYYSNELKLTTRARRLELSQQVTHEVAKIQKVAGVGFIATLIIALLLSGRFAYGIVSPITELTGTFRELATGKTEVTVPGTQRDDELGEMASAAEVFRTQNAQTQKLLEETKNLAAELAEQTTELEASNAELDHFAYIASHDLRSPLRGIRQLALWVCEDALEQLPPASVEHLEKMQARIGKMETLLEDLLQYSRAGKRDYSSETVDVNAMLGAIIELVENEAEISISIDSDLPILETFKTPLEQVFLNLITNAVKHNDKPGQGRVRITCRNAPEETIFHIADNGPGIAPVHHERVFQMYQRVGDGTVDGTGMGLAIVKKQIESHGGWIRIKSELGQGAEFIFGWPKNIKQRSENV